MTSCANQCCIAGSHEASVRARITTCAHKAIVATFSNNRRPYHCTGRKRQPRYGLKCLHLTANSRRQTTANSSAQIRASSRRQTAARSEQQTMPNSRRQNSVQQYGQATARESRAIETATGARSSAHLLPQNRSHIISPAGARGKRRLLLRNRPPIESMTDATSEPHLSANQ